MKRRIEMTELERQALIRASMEALIEPEPEFTGQLVHWEPIKTAPTDGVELLLWNGKTIMVGSYVPTVNQWYASGQGVIIMPTHWMFFPLPPEE
jgi:hypothetical protein